MIWTTVAIGVLLTFVVTAFLIVRADDAQKEVEAFITKHGFRASVPGDSLSQLVIDYPNSIHYYSIAEATKGQEDDAIESLEQMFKGWDKRDIDRFGAVYVNDNEDSLVYGIELRRQSIPRADDSGQVILEAGSALLLAVGRDQSKPMSLLEKIRYWIGL